MQPRRSTHSMIACLSLLSLAGCVKQQEQASQREAVEYNVTQHYSAQCADAGFLPGSDRFTQCMAKLSSSGH